MTMPTDGGSDRIFELQEEVRQLKEAVVSHAVVDQAIGMVVVLGRISPDQGWAVLKEVSQHTNIKLRNVAELILVWGRTGMMPREIRAELEDALDRAGPTRSPKRRRSSDPPGGVRRGVRRSSGLGEQFLAQMGKQLLSSRETCICEMPSCSAMRLCVMPLKNRR
ncbi:hypothetical protein STAFG_0838 [Streptomyces afghaniensis 772]|uniref:ANTAR domain-containing protein n=1 Tax=Streptomyces afghaniensis 772 TaxID=1283301 RepID=S4N0M0_9ACTN|nr:hypothetical protein STAFG_0838 [Streptomyces afghaniensis 772]